MKKYVIAALSVVALGAAIAAAQVFTMPPPAGVVVLGCVFQSAPPTLTNGQTGFAQCDSTGHISTGGGGVAATVNIAPSGSASVGITPVVSASAESSHVFKASGGNLYSAYVTNLSSTTGGFFQIFNATSAPSDGAVTPIACIPVAASTVASFNFAGPPAVYSTGITAVLSSATTCFTKTTGSITGFFSGSVQ